MLTYRVFYTIFRYSKLMNQQQNCILNMLCPMSLTVPVYKHCHSRSDLRLFGIDKYSFHVGKLSTFGHRWRHVFLKLCVYSISRGMHLTLKKYNPNFQFVTITRHTSSHLWCIFCTNTSQLDILRPTHCASSSYQNLMNCPTERKSLPIQMPASVIRQAWCHKKKAGALPSRLVQHKESGV